MDDEIHFGEFQHSQPEPGTAPDRDPFHAIAWVGADDEAMPIYVDVDVMLELETHALENVDVELGGVLLGEQLTDADGKPFVVVRDSLRAEHYHATRGSFKFTHETWEAITRQREQFLHPLEMVGWYHTHPGWGVFLSDMDMFICRHFFDRPLDVALVIDPIRDDRGWFAWTSDGLQRNKQRMNRFCLFGHRHRRSEIQAIADRYNENEAMPTDPRTRYAPPAATAAPTHVTVVERTIGTGAAIAVAAILLGQFLLMAVLLMRPNSPNQQANQRDPTQAELLVRERQALARADAFRAMLVDVVEKSPEQVGLVDRLTAVNTENEALKTNLDGQAALVREVNSKLGAAQKKLDQLSDNYNRLNETLAERNALITELQGRIDTIQKSDAGATSTAWFWYVLMAIIGLVIGVAGALGAAYLLRLRQRSLDDESDWGDSSRGDSGNESKIKLA
jgi:proteasome lid subunit RPN8/RPN11